MRRHSAKKKERKFMPCFDKLQEKKLVGNGFLKIDKIK